MKLSGTIFHIGLSSAQLASELLVDTVKYSFCETIPFHEKNLIVIFLRSILVMPAQTLAQIASHLRVPGRACQPLLQPLYVGVNWLLPEGPLISYVELQTTELIKACADSEHSAPWQEFVLRYQRPIALSVLRTLRRWGVSSPDIVEDLVQETYLKLCSDRCRHLLRFSLEHPQAVDGYIKTIATNVAHDYIKSQRSMKRGSGEVSQFTEHTEPGSGDGNIGGERAIQSAVLMREIDECLEQCVEGASQMRDRLIFWLHYQQGMTATAIATLPAVGLTTKGVESAIFRLTRQVRERLTAAQSGRSDPTSSEGKGLGSAKSY